MKLHIGGKEIKEGWKILNKKEGKGVDFVGDISDLSQFKDGSIEEIASFLPNLPSSNRNLSTYLKRKNYSFDTDLPTDFLATLVLLSIEDNLLVKSFMERSEDRPTRLHTALVKWLNLFKES